MKLLRSSLLVFLGIFFLQQSASAEPWFTADATASKTLSMSGEFTLAVRFRTDQDNATLAGVNGRDEWSRNGKVLFLKAGRLHYDIGWLGVFHGSTRCDDGEWHTAVVRYADGEAELFLDGTSEKRKKEFTAPPPDSSRFRIGWVANNFPGKGGIPFDGAFEYVRFWERALSDAAIKEVDAFTKGTTLNWKPDPKRKVRKIASAGSPEKAEALDHARLIREWDHNALDRGAKIYNSLCITCHGTETVEGTLPTALRFHDGLFKNGHAPFQMYETITKGFGQMIPQAWMTPRQKYDVIHYIRETFLEPHNKTQYTEVDDSYLASLPKGTSTGPEAAEVFGSERDPVYKKMDFGPYLFWTYQVDSDNIAYKALAVRLDPGPGGVSKGRAWMIYDHDTMRVAAAYTGDEFVDWRGIAFDGSHGTHTSIKGDRLFVNPVGPGIAHPTSGTWDDPRFIGRDDKPYGPLPRDWAHYKGLYLDGNKVVIKYTVGDTEILESPGLTDFGTTPIFSRSLNIGPSKQPIIWRLAPTAPGLHHRVTGENGATIAEENGFAVLHVPASAQPQHLTVFHTRAPEDQLAQVSGKSLADLSPHLAGGGAHWTETVITEIESTFDEGGAFAVDRLAAPDENPWSAWMRLGGFDFDPNDPNKAAVCTWMGDVWIVEGIAGTPPGKLTWKRIATGLFQPLGLKYRDGEIFVTCRDQLARLHDLNGNGEIDYVESFNNDHQVTEHFHEFAMGLQTDDDGNFYYAKSARHAKVALVAHHGTLLKISKDGRETEIIASGFRAANGVCLNPDGSFIVTDQEGHWNPKNRINYVKKGGFYGNMYGYHNVTDSADTAMEQPLCWITNEFDRSPAELLWVPEYAKWGGLKGSLLNLSYGYGQVYVVPHEVINGQAQGGMCALPIPRLPTGIMRGRFSPADGQLYTCGMFAWAGNQQKPGGFYRVRYTDKPARLPVNLQAAGKTLTLTFSDPVDEASATKPEAYAVKAWDLKRTKNYGSKHYNERALEVEKATVTNHGKSVILTLPELAPTWGMSVSYELTGSDGEGFTGKFHNTIHTLDAE